MFLELELHQIIASTDLIINIMEYRINSFGYSEMLA